MLLSRVRAAAVGSVAVCTVAACSTSSAPSQTVEAGAQPSQVSAQGSFPYAVPPAPGVPGLPVVAATPNGPGGPGGPAKPAAPAAEPPGAGQPALPQGRSVTNAFVSKITGAQSYSHTDKNWGVAGAAWAVPFADSRGRTLVAFGDTFGGPRATGEQATTPPLVDGSGLNVPIIPSAVKIPVPDIPLINIRAGGQQGSGSGSGGSGNSSEGSGGGTGQQSPGVGWTGTTGPTGFDWRSNSLAVADVSNPSAGMKITSFISDRPGHAKEILQSAKAKGAEETVIPTSGFAIGDRTFLTYTSIRNWGPSSGQWVSNYSGIAYSDDGGTTWFKAPKAVWRNSERNTAFQMTSAVVVGDEVYLYGSPPGRIGGVFVSKTKTKDVLDSSKYKVWNGGEFSAAEKTAPSPLAWGALGDFNVAYHPGVQRFVMVNTDMVRNAIVMRQSASALGPWSDPEIIASGTDYPSLYAPRVLPGSSGNDLYFVVSQFNSYNTYLMHTNVTKQNPKPPAQLAPVTLPGGAQVPSIPVPDVGQSPLPNAPFLPPGPAQGAPTGPTSQLPPNTGKPAPSSSTATARAGS